MKHINLYSQFESLETPQKWKIYAGLSGGFGGAHYIETITGSRDDAEKLSYSAAIEEYESYEGYHGLRTVSNIMDEDDVDQSEAEEIYNEKREDWLDYYVKPDDGIKESIKIKDTNSLIIGNKYRITWPNYEEGIEPDTDSVEVIDKNSVDGYVFRSIENDFTFSRHPNMLNDYEIELLEGLSINNDGSMEDEEDETDPNEDIGPGDIVYFSGHGTLFVVSITADGYLVSEDETQRYMGDDGNGYIIPLSSALRSEIIEKGDDLEEVSEKWTIRRAIPRDPYLVKYTIINHKATLEEPNIKRIRKFDAIERIEKIISSKESKEYEYVIFAISNDEAREKFTKLWDEYVGGFRPSPVLKIKSIEEIKSKYRKEKMEDLPNKIHVY